MTAEGVASSEILTWREERLTRWEAETTPAFHAQTHRGSSITGKVCAYLFTRGLVGGVKCELLLL